MYLWGKDSGEFKKHYIPKSKREICSLSIKKAFFLNAETESQTEHNLGISCPGLKIKSLLFGSSLLIIMLGALSDPGEPGMDTHQDIRGLISHSAFSQKGKRRMHREAPC